MATQTGKLEVLLKQMNKALKKLKQYFLVTLLDYSEFLWGGS